MTIATYNSHCPDILLWETIINISSVITFGTGIVKEGYSFSAQVVRQVRLLLIGEAVSRNFNLIAALNIIF